MEQPLRCEVVVKLFDLLERAMGIEPTSEAWEACCRLSKNAQVGSILSFFKVLKWIPIGAADGK
jgi:hypothetical protein